MADIDPLAALYAEWEHLDALLAGLGEDAWSAPSPCPGWDVRDVVTHVWGTELMLAGEPVPDVDLSGVDTAHVHDGLGELNEKWVVHGRGFAPAEALAEFRRACALRREQLGAMTREQLDEPTPSPIGVVPYREFMRVRVFDTAIHELDVRDAVGLPPRIEDTPEWRIVLEHVLRSLPRTVGKKAAAPEGARVRLSLTDAGAEDLDIVVSEGRAAPRSSDDTVGPTTHLTTDTATLVRAACGRIRAETAGVDDDPGPGRVVVAGDRALGEAVVENLVFTP